MKQTTRTVQPKAQQRRSASVRQPTPQPTVTPAGQSFEPTETLHAGHNFAQLRIEPHLSLGPTNDQFEREAEHMAQVVRSGAAPLAAGQPTAEQQIQRQPQIAPLATPANPDNLVAPELAHAITARQGQGQALPFATRAALEPRFGHDFGAVRIHHDPAADALSRSLGARAFTVGRDIFFQAGQFAPATPTGQSLLAHELTHTIQQRRAAQQIQRTPDLALRPPPRPSVRRQSTLLIAQLPAQVGAGQAVAISPAEHAADGQEPAAEQPAAQAAPDLPNEERALAPTTNASPLAVADVQAEPTPKTSDDQSLPSLDAVPAMQELQQAASDAAAAPTPNMGSTDTAAGQASASGEAQTATAELEAATTEAGAAAPAKVSFGLPNPPVDPWSNPALAGAVPSAIQRRFLEGHRQEANGRARTFSADVTERMQSLTNAGQTISPRIMETASEATTAIQARVAEQQAIVVEKLTEARKQAHGKAGWVLKRIKNQHEATAKAMDQAAKDARVRIRKAYDDGIKSVNKREREQLQAVEAMYVKADLAYRAAGTEVGKLAIERSENAAKAYRKKIKGRDDSVLDGPLSDDRNRARADTAIKVGQEYKKGLVEEANKQADSIEQTRLKDMNDIRAAARQARDTLFKQYGDSIQQLNTNATESTTQVNGIKTSLDDAVNQALKATLHSLTKQKKAQLGQLAGYGERQVLAVERDAAQAIAALQGGITTAVHGLQAALEGFQAAINGTPAPDVEALQEALDQSFFEVDGAVESVTESLESGVGTALDALAQAQQSTLEAVTALGENALAQIKTASEGFGSAISKISPQVKKTFSELETSYISGVSTSLASTEEGFRNVDKEIETLFTDSAKLLRDGFQENVKGIRKGLKDALRELPKDIRKYAKEAAAQVQPRWKSVLKVVLVIVVVLVVAFVVGPLLVGLGPVAAVAAGAAVGAASGAVIQMGNNLIDGKDLMHDVGKAAIVGGIGGAFGGLGGVLFKGVANVGLKVGLDIGVDVVGSIVGDLAVGNPITLESVAMGAAMGLGISGGIQGLGKLAGKFKPPIKVDTPDVKVEPPAIKVEPPIKVPQPAIKVDSPKIKADAASPLVDAPKVDAPKVEVPSIKVDQPTVKVDQPTVKPDQPGVKLDAPKVDAPEVKVDPAGSAPSKPAPPDQAAIKTDEPAVKVDEPTVKVDDPAIKVEQPTAKPAQPKAGKPKVAKSRPPQRAPKPKQAPAPKQTPAPAAKKPTPDADPDIMARDPDGAEPTPIEPLRANKHPDDLKFSQRDIAPQTNDGMPIDDLINSMKTGGWKGDGINTVQMPDGSIVSLDNRRLYAARKAGLKEIPIKVHAPDAPFPKAWAVEGKFRLKEYHIRRLPDGTLVVGGTKGEIAYPKGYEAKTYGEAAMIRAANQGNVEIGGVKSRFPLGGSMNDPVIRKGSGEAAPGATPPKPEIAPPIKTEVPDATPAVKPDAPDATAAVKPDAPTPAVKPDAPDATPAVKPDAPADKNMVERKPDGPIRTQSPSGNMYGWGDYDITNSNKWLAKDPSRFTKLDHRFMATLKRNATRVPELDPARWSQVPLARKQLVIEKLIKGTMQTMGIPRAHWPKIDLAHTGGYGSARWGTDGAGVIRVNMTSSVGDILGTVFHEGRHYYQSWQVHQANNGLRDLSKLHPDTPHWVANTRPGKYIRSGKPGYYEQPVESDAETFARLLMDALPGNWPPPRPYRRP